MTWLTRGLPLRASRRFCTASAIMLLLVCTVALPMCAVKVTFCSLDRGWSSGRGSGSVTSRAAAAMVLFWSASSRAPVSMMLPVWKEQEVVWWRRTCVKTSRAWYNHCLNISDKLLLMGTPNYLPLLHGCRFSITTPLDHTSNSPGTMYPSITSLLVVLPYLLTLCNIHMTVDAHQDKQTQH